MRYVPHGAESVITRALDSKTKRQRSDCWHIHISTIILISQYLMPVYLQGTGHLQCLMRARRCCDDEAVSPVIATVLLMAITVLLASSVYLLIDDAIAPPEKGAPYAKLSVRALDNGFQIVRFTDLSQNLHTSTVTFTISPPAGVNASSITGQVNDADVYGSVGEVVAFHDRDASFTVNRGDYFVINASSAGTADGDWTMYIRAVGTSGTTLLGEIPLPATQ